MVISVPDATEASVRSVLWPPASEDQQQLGRHECEQRLPVRNTALLILLRTLLTPGDVAGEECDAAATQSSTSVLPSGGGSAASVLEVTVAPLYANTFWHRVEIIQCWIMYVRI